MSRLKKHVAVRPGDFDVAAMQIVVEIDLFRLATRAADDDDLAAIACQRHRGRYRIGHACRIGDDLDAAATRYALSCSFTSPAVRSMT